MKAIKVLSTISLSLLCLALVVGAWAYAWRLDDQRNHPGWRTDAVRVVSADWLTCADAFMVRVTRRGGEPEDWPEGFTAVGWLGLRSRDFGGSSEESVRHEVAMQVFRQLIDGGEVWVVPAIAGQWRASEDEHGRKLVHIWVLQRGEWIEVERWARESWYTRESVGDATMIDEYAKTLGELTECPTQQPPQVKPHPPSDPDNTGLPALFEWVSRRPELIEKLQFLKRETERLGS